jgi:hypothetical protein
VEETTKPGSLRTKLKDSISHSLIAKVWTGSSSDRRGKGRFPSAARIGEATVSRVPKEMPKSTDEANRDRRSGTGEEEDAAIKKLDRHGRAS